VRDTYQRDVAVLGLFVHIELFEHGVTPMQK